MNVRVGELSSLLRVQRPVASLSTRGFTGLPALEGSGRLSPYDGSNGRKNCGSFGSRRGGYLLRNKRVGEGRGAISFAAGSSCGGASAGAAAAVAGGAAGAQAATMGSDGSGVTTGAGIGEGGAACC